MANSTWRFMRIPINQKLPEMQKSGYTSTRGDERLDVQRSNNRYSRVILDDTSMQTTLIHLKDQAEDIFMDYVSG